MICRLYVVDLRTEFDGLCFLTSYYRMYIMTLNADPSLCMRSFSKSLIIRRLSFLVLETFLFLAAGQIGLYHIRLFVTGTPYAKFPAMMPVELFKTFPKEFHVCWKTQMVLITGGIGHAYVKVVKIRFPVLWSQYLPEGTNVKTGCCLITDGTDYLEVGYGKGGVCHDSAGHLVVYVVVEMFLRLSVGESSIRLQDHKGAPWGRSENVPATQILFQQACCFCYTLEQKHRMKPAKLILIKTPAVFFQNIKFSKAQS